MLFDRLNLQKFQVGRFPISRLGEVTPIEGSDVGWILGMKQPDASEQPKLTPWQRLAVREVRRAAGRSGDEPMSSEDWAAAYELSNGWLTRAMHRVWLALPSSPRCGRCGAPFAGPGRWIVRPLGYRPSRKNPTICATCVDLTARRDQDGDRSALRRPPRFHSAD